MTERDYFEVLNEALVMYMEEGGSVIESIEILHTSTDQMIMANVKNGEKFLISKNAIKKFHIIQQKIEA